MTENLCLISDFDLVIFVLLFVLCVCVCVCVCCLVYMCVWVCVCGACGCVVCQKRLLSTLYNIWLCLISLTVSRSLSLSIILFFPCFSYFGRTTVSACCILRTNPHRVPQWATAGPHGKCSLYSELLNVVLFSTHQSPLLSKNKYSVDTSTRYGISLFLSLSPSLSLPSFE